MDNLVYWIWLSLSCTIGTGTFATLIREFNDPQSIYEADEFAISRCLGPKLSDRATLADKDLSRAEKIYNYCQKYDIDILTYSDPRYPIALAKTKTPPVLLYCRGQKIDFNKGVFVAAVGTRDLSEYGRKNAFRISYDLATAGATIVSGMATGIDGVAHSGALVAERPTVAVLGSGIDVCYPPCHLTLAREIVKRGCVITEYPPKTSPLKPNFPKRNRIISGLSAATVVFEGPERSGAFITARYAKEEGRPLFALPANVGSPQSELSNLLLKDGAIPCTRAEDVINVLEKEYPGALNPFMLKSKCPYDMMKTLRKFSVDANCPNDDIFKQPWMRKHNGWRTKRGLEPIADYEDNQEIYRDRGEVNDFSELSSADHNLGFDSSQKEFANRSVLSQASVPQAFSVDNGGEAKTSEMGRHINSEESDRKYSKAIANQQYNYGINSEYGKTDSLRDKGNMNSQKTENQNETQFSGQMNSGVGSVGFDKAALELYKLIPSKGACAIEDLVNDKTPYRTIIKLLTKLEAGKFVVVLPGGKVMRKTK